MFSGEWPVSRLLIGALRRKFPDALIVAGGEHITALTEYSLRDCPEIDFCVRGEGEQIFVNLLEELGAGTDPRGNLGDRFSRHDGNYCQPFGSPSKS